MTSTVAGARFAAGAAPSMDVKMPADEPSSGAREPSRRKRRRVDFWGILAIVVVAVALLWAAVPGLFATHDPLLNDPPQRLLPPSVEHWFGTDQLGRDLWSRTVHAAGLSLQATALAVAIGLVAGSAIGLVAGYLGGLVDDVVMRVVDILLAIPSLLLAMAIVTALGFGTMNVAVAVGVGAVASFARLMRSEVLKVRHTPFVEAAAGLGVGLPTILRRHVLPNAITPVLALATLEFGSAVLAVSALSFLGFGALPPTPEWGSLIAEGRNFLATAWWLTTLPGLVVVAVVLATHRLSSTVRTSLGRHHVV